jgi:hypothetical protein
MKTIREFIDITNYLESEPLTKTKKKEKPIDEVDLTDGYFLHYQGKEGLV